jgi:methionine-rich copper-binding protein CopC
MTAARVCWMVAALLLMVAVALSTSIESALAQPEVTETNVETGDVLDTAPEMLSLCFSEPINTQDIEDYVPDEEGERPWRFTVTPPEGPDLGLRNVFDADGNCVDVFPGLPEDPAEGIWTFDWMVRSQETNEEASGVITFRVGPGDPPASEPEGDDGSGTDTAVITIIAVSAGVALVVLVGGAIVVTRRGRGTSSTG